ncbi:MAG TPA: poly(R)-hydroxyalkanoic acid synthase subunit PhaE [Leptolyngbyaceae cyanobacterium]
MEPIEQGWVYLKGLQTLGQICLEPLSRVISPSRDISDRTTDPVSPQVALSELFGLYTHFWNQVSGHALPNVEPIGVGDFPSQLLKTLEAWIKFQQASFQYQGVQTSVWIQTFDNLMQVLSSSNSTDGKIETWQQLLQVWSRLFDQTFAQTHNSGEALNIQMEFLNTALQFRQQQQKLAEMILQVYDLPTRHEIDEIHRSLYELRKAIKTLSKPV